jgi:hypothetical protein
LASASQYGLFAWQLITVIGGLSWKAAIVVAAITVLLALNYGHALIWMIRYTVRLISGNVALLT